MSRPVGSRTTPPPRPRPCWAHRSVPPTAGSRQESGYADPRLRAAHSCRFQLLRLMAGGEVVAAEPVRLRLLQAALEPLRAAGAEDASRRNLDQVRQVARYGREIAGRLRDPA